MATTSRDNSKSHPYFTQKVKLHSLHAQQVFDRGFELCASAIFSLSVVLRIIGTDQQAREVEGMVDERLNKAFEDIRGEAARLEKLAEANGIEFKGIEYSRPKEVEAKITSPLPCDTWGSSVSSTAWWPSSTPSGFLVWFLTATTRAASTNGSAVCSAWPAASGRLPAGP